MKAGACWRWRVRGAASLLAVLAALYFAPAPARAGCGDYVVLGPTSSSFAPHAAPAHEPGPSTPAKQNQPAPCSGPNCSRAPVEAPLTPPNPSDGPDEQWASVLSSFTADTPGPGTW